VTTLSIFNDILITGSADSTFRVWNMNKWELSSTIKSGSNVHKSSSILGTKGMFASSTENVVKIWNINNGKNMHNLKIHNGDITSIIYDHKKDVMITTSLDKTIKLIPLNTLKVSSTITTTQPIIAMQVSDNLAAIAHQVWLKVKK
jgi:WD40 repeat protein